MPKYKIHQWGWKHSAARFNLWSSGSGHLIIYCACRYQSCAETRYLYQQCGTEIRWASGWLHRSRRNNLNTEDRNGQWEEGTWSLKEQWLMVGLVPECEEGTLAFSFQGYWIPCRIIEPRVTKLPSQSYRSRVTNVLSQSYRSRVTNVLSQSYRSRVKNVLSQSYRSRETNVLSQNYRSRVTNILSQSYRSKSDKRPFTKLQKQSDKRPFTKLQKQSDKRPFTKLQK
jgi:hypothetical protein